MLEKDIRPESLFDKYIDLSRQDIIKIFYRKKKRELNVLFVEYLENSILEKIVSIMIYVVTAHQFIIAHGLPLVHLKILFEFSFH